jgi:hypothetical protein
MEATVDLVISVAMNTMIAKQSIKRPSIVRFINDYIQIKVSIPKNVMVFADKEDGITSAIIFLLVKPI